MPYTALYSELLISLIYMYLLIRNYNNVFYAPSHEPCHRYSIISYTYYAKLNIISLHNKSNYTGSDINIPSIDILSNLIFLKNRSLIKLSQCPTMASWNPDNNLRTTSWSRYYVTVLYLSSIFLTTEIKHNIDFLFYSSYHRNCNGWNWFSNPMNVFSSYLADLNIS